MISENNLIVKNWHEALNSGNTGLLASLVHENIKIGGPRGIAEGVQIMLEWVERARIKLTPLRFFARGNTVAVEELGEWHSETGEITGTQNVTSVFFIREDKITGINRYDNLETALEVSGLNQADEL